MRFLKTQLVVVLCGILAFAVANVIPDDEVSAENSLGDNWQEQFTMPSFWMNDAQRTLMRKLKRRVPNENNAKNVIFFLGDGMSVPTVTASRIYEGQLEGILGERNLLAMDNFPYVGLSMTYCADRQVSDSACTSTAYLCGVKANYQTLGLSANATYNDCASEQYADNRVDSIAAWAQAAGKATGIVTTTRITHASPAGSYAHASNRDFESDYDIVRLNGDPAVCQDIANQLVYNDVSSKFKVILGGGLQKFLPNTTKDSNNNRLGERLDGRDLIKEWATTKKGKSETVYNRKQLMSIDYSQTDHLLGLFAPSHMPYHLDSDPAADPTLLEMTEVAIKMLQKSKKGYFLFVEGGRIDHAHHDTTAHKALDETVEFSKAIQRAYDITDPKETLIVVTADHGHTMTISGYSEIGNSITGLSTDLSDVDGLPYATLSYANGPSYHNHIKEDGERRNVSNLDYENKDFKYPSSVPLIQETHGGGDVAVYATGPWAHLFSGVMEENVLPHLMGYASCVGPGLNMCRRNRR